MSNVIIRNIATSKVLAENGDAIGVRKMLPDFLETFGRWLDPEKSTNVWTDHVDVSSDQDRDGLLDVRPPPFHSCLTPS